VDTLSPTGLCTSILSQPHTVRTYILYFDKREKGGAVTREKGRGQRGNSGDKKTELKILR
jgi:hypothetical protein